MDYAEGDRAKTSSAKNSPVQADGLTVEEVLAVERLSHLTREQAKEYIECVELYCLVMYQLYCKTQI